MSLMARRPFPVFAVLALSALAVALALVALPRIAEGASTKITAVTATGTAHDGDLKQVIASCPADYDATGGGYEIASINPAIFVHQDTPLTPDVNDGVWGWAVTLLNETGGDVTFGVQVLCQKK
jgi:hypothetical protein